MKTPFCVRWSALPVVLAAVVVLVGCPQPKSVVDVALDTSKLDPPAVRIPSTPVPILLTFTGQVVDIVEDGTGAAANAGLVEPVGGHSGTPVIYTVLVGLQDDGYVVDNNGYHMAMPDTATEDYVYAAMNGGWLMAMVDGGFFNAGTDIADMRFGRSVLTPGPGTAANPKGKLVLGSNNHSLVIAGVGDSASLILDNWDFFTEVGGSEQVHDSSGNTTTVFTWLKLTGIEGLTPPPPPPPPDPPLPPAGSSVYTFEGEVFLIRDNAGAAAAAGVVVGDPVTLEVAVHLTETGYVMDNVGNIIERADAGPLNYFFGQLLSGSLIDPVGDGYYVGPHALASISFGLDLSIPIGSYDQPIGRFWLGDSNDRLAIVRPDLKVANWTVGTQMPAVEETLDGFGNVTGVYMNLTLTSIVPYVPPTP
ncbi:MAG: hypothetical protein GY851_28910 [bacterium]|nr:hypothetical protein [bacterium]